MGLVSVLFPSLLAGMALQQCPKQAGAQGLPPKAGEHRNWPASSPSGAPVLLRSQAHSGVLWVGAGAEGPGGGLGWRDGSCCAAASPRQAGTMCTPGEGVSGGWAGAGCLHLPRCLPCPFLSSELGLDLLLVPLRLLSCLAWGSVSGGAAGPAAQEPCLLPKAAHPAWVEALCHWSWWKSSTFRPGLMPALLEKLRLPHAPCVSWEGALGTSSAAIFVCSLLLLLFLAVLICIDSDFLAGGGHEAEGSVCKSSMVIRLMGHCLGQPRPESEADKIAAPRVPGTTKQQAWLLPLRCLCFPVSFLPTQGGLQVGNLGYVSSCSWKAQEQSWFANFSQR